MNVSAVPSTTSGIWNKALDAAKAVSPDIAAKAKASGAASPSEIKRAASQFEAIILRQLLAPTIEPLMSGGLGGAGAGGGGGVYGYMLTDVLADSLSKGGGLGLSKMLTRQLTPRGTPTVEVSLQSEAPAARAASPESNF
ncbi:MAG: rod-binding protein [Opitutaceae bacterium]|nr:rod-binding protein [Opitutaceae bacterium]